MKDYSLNQEERKDFVLGYEPDDSGNITVSFAEGESWCVPYTEKNEQILLKKMNEQVEKSDEFYKKKKEECSKVGTRAVTLIAISFLILCFALNGEFLPLIFSMSSISGVLSIPFIVKSVRISSILKDLEKNRKFLEIEKDVNDNVRINQNILANVSKKTKDIIDKFPDDEHIFNINSFNYVPFKDLEQIMENVERNERFGFEYDSDEVINTPIIKKKIR